jgi:prepilin-type N-terminal cleavage/methylation domain-containing protein
MNGREKEKNALPGGIRRTEGGFTLLELIVVLFLITLIAGLSTAFLGNALPAGKFNSTVRGIATTIRHARALAQTKGEEQTVVIDLDSKKYGIEGRGEKDLAPGTEIMIIDPFSNEINEGVYRFVFPAFGGSEGGTIVLNDQKRKARIDIDPVTGAEVNKTDAQ